MTDINGISRSLHDLGLSAWFGGTLMGAVGINEAAAPNADEDRAARVASAGWSAWTPVNLAAIAAHLAGGTYLLGANRGRLHGQKGVASASTVKLALTGAALAATAYSRLLGQKVMHDQDAPAEGGTQPAAGTPQEMAKAQRQLHTLQWVIPAITGAMVVVNAVMGEQQKPKEVVSGILSKVMPSH